MANIVETFSFGWNDFFTLDGWIAELESLLASHPGLPSPEIEALVTVAMFGALMHRRPQHADMELWVQRAGEVACNSPSTNHRVIVGMQLGTYYVLLCGLQAHKGVESAHFAPDRPHLLLVSYDAGNIHSWDVLSYVRKEHVNAELIGGL